MRTDGKTNRLTNVTKILVAFPNFAKAPKNCRNSEKKSLCVIMELDCA